MVCSALENTMILGCMWQTRNRSVQCIQCVGEAKGYFVVFCGIMCDSIMCDFQNPLRHFTKYHKVKITKISLQLQFVLCSSFVVNIHGLVD